MLQQDEFMNMSKMNFDVSEEQTMILDQVDRICKEIRPVEDQCYLQRKINDQVKPIFARAHLLGLPVSRKYGDGQGADMVTYALAIERIGREGTGIRTFFSVHMALCEMTIQHWANEEQKQRVPAELEHVAAVALGDVDQPRVAAADQHDELLGAELAPLGEPLRERGEARDVEPDERRVELAAVLSRRFVVPARCEPRHERAEACCHRDRRAHLVRAAVWSR